METSFEKFNNRFKKVIAYYEKEYGPECKISLHHWKMLQGQCEEGHLKEHLREFEKLNEENKQLNFTEDLLTQIISEKDERIEKLTKALKMMMREHEDQAELKESLDFANDVLEQIDNGF